MADKPPRSFIEKKLQRDDELDGELTFALEISCPDAKPLRLRVFRKGVLTCTLRPDSIEKCLLAGAGGSVPERPPPGVPEAIARTLIFSDQHVESIYARMILAHMFSPARWRSDPGETEESSR